MNCFSHKFFNNVSFRKVQHLLLVLFSVTLFWSCKTVYYPEKSVKQQYDISEKYAENKEINDLITPYKKVIDTEMNKLLAHSDYDLTKEGLSSTLGNFLSDILYNDANEYTTQHNLRSVDLVLLNSGGMRTTLKKGAVTVGDVFEIMPFENEMVIVEISGNKMWDLIQYLNITKKGHPISHLNVEWNNNKFVSATINGKPFDKNKTYTIATNDYLQKGGDDMNFFLNPIQIINTNVKVRDAFIRQIGKIKLIPLNKEQRLKL